MNGKERLALALSRRPVDRPPYDFWAEDAALNRLFTFLKHSDMGAFLDAMEVDIREVSAAVPAEKPLSGGVFQNYWGERYVYRDTPYGKIRDDMPGALSGITGIGEIRDFEWPKNDDIDFTGLKNKCAAIREKGCAVRYGFGDIWQRPSLVRGMENALTDMYDNPEWVHCLGRIFTDFYIEDYKRAWESSGGTVDLFLIMSDMGTQRGPLISLDLFRRFIAPYLQELVELVHSFGAKAMFHSCGDISLFIPDLIRIGVDVLDPIQPVNGNMQPEALAPYKDSICFHGGVDLQSLLIKGTPETIKGRVKTIFSILGSSYIAAPTHLFQPDVPPENMAAVYGAFR
jgi:uroporphyrinogen decarboxylase